MRIYDTTDELDLDDDFGLDDDMGMDDDDDLGLDDLDDDDDMGMDDDDDDFGLDDLDDDDDDMSMDDDDDDGDEEMGQDENGSFGFLMFAPLLAAATGAAAVKLTGAHRKQLVHTMPHLKRASLTKIANSRLRSRKVRAAATAELARRQRGGQQRAWPASMVSRRQVLTMPGLPRYVPPVARTHRHRQTNTVKTRQQLIQLQARRAAAVKARKAAAVQRRAARPQQQDRRLPVAAAVKSGAGKVNNMLAKRKAAHAAKPAKAPKPGRRHGRRGGRNQEEDSMGGIAGSMFATVALLTGTFAAGTFLGPKLVDVTRDKVEDLLHR